MKYVTVLETSINGQIQKRALVSGPAEVCNVAMTAYLNNNKPNVNEKVYVTLEKEYLKEIKPPSGKQVLMENE